jgi:hypothetical protein
MAQARNIIYCAVCGTYYLRKDNKLIKIDSLEVTAKEMSKCLDEPERYWGGFSHPKSCGCEK